MKFIDRLETGLNPAVGSVIAVVVVYSFLFYIGVFVAGNVVDLLENNVFKAYYEPFKDYCFLLLPDRRLFDG